MRRILFGLVLAVCPIFATAQVQWSVRGGLGTSFFVANSGEYPQFSYRLGGGVSVPIGRKFSFQPSLYLARKGFRFDGYMGSEQITEARYRVSMDYLELPLNMVAHIRLAKASCLNLYLGPYVACGINSKAHVKSVSGDYRHTFGEDLFEKGSKLLGVAYNNQKEHVELPRFRRLDAGLQSGIELDINKVLIGFETSLGLTPVSNSPVVSDDIVGQIVQGILFGTTKPHNIVIQATVGYRF